MSAPTVVTRPRTGTVAPVGLQGRHKETVADTVGSFFVVLCRSMRVSLLPPTREGYNALDVDKINAFTLVACSIMLYSLLACSISCSLQCVFIPQTRSNHDSCTSFRVSNVK